MKTAQQAQANWTGSSGRAATDWAAGVAAYSGDWAAATTRQQSVMLTNLTNAISSGRWAAGVNRVGTSGWKSRTQAKQPNYATGFQAGAERYAAASQKIITALNNIVPSLPPRGDFTQNKQRATALMDALHSLKGQLGAA